MAKLTERSIKKLPRPRTGAIEYSDELLDNLVLRRFSTGGDSWCVRYRLKDSPQQRRLTLGKWPALSVEAARDQAAMILRRVAKGDDPQGEKAVLQSGDVHDAFPSLAERFIEQHCKAKNRTWVDQARVLGLRLNWFDRRTAADKPRWHIIDGSPAEHWQKKPVADIKRRDVAELLSATVSRRGPIAANKLRAVLSRAFAWFVEQGILEQSPVVGTRPPSPTTKRDRALNDNEVLLLWKATEANYYYPFDPFVRLLLLTGQRRGEVAGMRLSEISGGVWTIPARRTKNGVEHQVPLSKAALQIVRSLPRDNDLLFSTNGTTPISGFSKAKRQLDAAVENVPPGISLLPWSLHDLRRTFSTGANALGVDPIVVEKVLNHALPGVSATYNRHDYLSEKRAALEKWSQHVLKLVADYDAQMASLSK